MQNAECSGNPMNAMIAMIALIIAVDGEIRVVSYQGRSFKGIHFKDHADHHGVYYLALSRIYTLRRVFLSGGILHPQYPSAASGYYYLGVSPIDDVCRILAATQGHPTELQPEIPSLGESSDEIIAS
jgi:hypothetical protein